MILYVNGDSHSAAAEAVNSYCFAQDDPLYYSLGRIPHPDNEKVSYGCNIANALGAVLHCDAESASSNDRIIRTTREYLKNEGTPTAIIIGWATWEREEWFHKDTWLQVTASGTDYVPKELTTKYKQWIVDSVSERAEIEMAMHEKIWNFHQELKNIPHLFFNTYNTFAHIRLNNLSKYDWGLSYLDPYSEELTYYQWLKDHGCQTVNLNSYHFGSDAHKKWAEFLLPHLTRLL